MEPMQVALNVEAAEGGRGRRVVGSRGMETRSKEKIETLGRGHRRAGRPAPGRESQRTAAVHPLDREGFDVDEVRRDAPEAATAPVDSDVSQGAEDFLEGGDAIVLLVVQRQRVF